MIVGVYTSYANRLFLTGGQHDSTNLWALGVGDGYTFDPGHDYLNDITDRVSGAAWDLGTTSVSAGTVQAASDIALAVFTGDDITGLVIYVYNAVESAAALCLHLSQVAGMPLHTNGGPIALNVNPSGLIRLRGAT